jgi:hypothetical protein
MHWQIVLAALGLAVCFSATPAQVFDPGGMESLRLKPQAQRAVKPEGVDVGVWPTTVLDAGETHYLNRGAPTPMILAPANPNGMKLARAWVVVEVPEEVTLVATNAYLVWHLAKRQETEREGRGYVRYEFPCTVHPTTFPEGPGKGGWYQRSRPPALWLRTDAPEGPLAARLYFRVRYAERVPGVGKVPAAELPPRDGPERSVKLAVLPALESAQPKIAQSGVMGRFTFNTSQAPGMPKMMTEYVRQLGCTYYVGGPSMKEAPPGLARWVEAPLQNGYAVSTGEEIPAEVKYLHPGKDYRAVSPWAIYRRHPWVVRNVIEPMRKGILEGHCRVWWSNWEPYEYIDHPDFSEGSLREFIAWSKLPAEELRKLWPLEAVRKYEVEHKAFRVWELGQVTRAAAEEIAAAGREKGVAARFSIGISSSGIGTIMPLEDLPLVVQSWQYLNVPEARGPWPVSDRCGFAQIVRSGNWARLLEKDLGPQRRIAFGCLYGWDQTSGGGGFFMPEQLGFLHLSTVMAGAENAQNYAEWPVWDGRYARELAGANARIARWEEFTLRGKKERTHVVIPVSPYPQRTPEGVTPAEQDALPSMAKEGAQYLFSYEYLKEGKRLIAIANAWDYADVFVKFKAPGREAESRWRLTEPEQGRLFAAGLGRLHVTGAELAEGIVLHIGATRWGAFLLEPYAPGAEPPREIVLPEGVRKAMDGRLAAWADALERDRRVYRQDFEGATVGPVGSVKHGDLIIDDTLCIGIPLAGKGGSGRRVGVEESAGGKALRVTDGGAGGLVYVACPLGAQEGTITFDLALKRIAPVTLSLHPAGIVLTLPTAESWREWFDTPYRPTFVWFEKSADAARHPRGVRAVDSGVLAEAGRAHRMTFEWRNTARTGGIAIDGKTVASGVAFTHPNPKVAAESMTFSAFGAFGGKAGDGGDFTIDNIKIMKPDPAK